MGLGCCRVGRVMDGDTFLKIAAAIETAPKFDWRTAYVRQSASTPGAYEVLIMGFNHDGDAQAFACIIN